MDLRPSLAPALEAFGLPAVVTLPGGAPVVATTIIWLPPTTEEIPSASNFRRAEARRLMVIPSADLPEVPRGSRVVAAEVPGAAEATWVVDSTSRVDGDHHRVVVLPG